jgi:hypothetical protein
MADPPQRESQQASRQAIRALVERVRPFCAGDGNEGIPILAVRQQRRHVARGLRTRIILRMEDSTPVARLLRP